MGRTHITDEGLKEVAKLQNLKLLFLSRTHITDAGLKELAKFGSILYLSGNVWQPKRRGRIKKTKKSDEGVTPMYTLSNCTIYGP